MKKIEKLAIIYTRVSSIQQETDGSGNKSQEVRCREYATSRNLEVVEVFRDRFSGAGDFMERPEMRNLINYLEDNKSKGKEYTVIFDDLKRFARDTEFHIRLKTVFKKYSVTLECLNFKFEDSPEGRFVETVFAAQNQLEREQNKRQVIQKQRARMLDGYWPYRAFSGYDQVKSEGQGKVSVQNEKAKYIKEVLEDFAEGNIKSITEVGKFLYEKGVINASGNNKQCDTGRSMLQNIFYAGYIENIEKDVSLRIGKHKGIISLQTHYKIIEIISKREKSERNYEIYREDFPLRGIVRCLSCGKKLRSYLTTNKTKAGKRTTPYYECKNSECEAYGKTLKPVEVHEKFKNIFSAISPKEEAVQIGLEAFNEAMDEFLLDLNTNKKDDTHKIKDIEVQIDNLVNLSTKTSNQKVQDMYMGKIEKLTLELDKISKKDESILDTDTISRISLDKMFAMMKNPYNIWDSCNSKQKSELYRYIFSEDFYINRNYECRIPILSPIYQYFQGFSGNLSSENLETHHLWRWGHRSPVSKQNHIESTTRSKA